MWQKDDEMQYKERKVDNGKMQYFLKCVYRSQTTVSLLCFS